LGDHPAFEALLRGHYSRTHCLAHDGGCRRRRRHRPRCLLHPGSFGFHLDSGFRRNDGSGTKSFR
jgi:hypothetical protein